MVSVSLVYFVNYINTNFGIISLLFILYYFCFYLNVSPLGLIYQRVEGLLSMYFFGSWLYISIFKLLVDISILLEVQEWIN